MTRSDIHCHSRFSDGRDSLEDMVRSAIEKGFVSLGFSEHAWTPYDADCCIKREDIPDYLAEAARLKEVYRGQIELYTGFEVDCHECTDKAGLDYTIGSVHYLHNEATGEYYTVDYRPETFEKARDLLAGGDIRAMVRMYFDHVASFAESYRPDVVGHIDLITKLNRDGRYFDEDSGWYRALMEETAGRIAATGCIVEVNTGGISRGYRSVPYPTESFLRILRHQGVPVTLNSDAHAAENLGFWFAEAESLLRRVGYTSIRQLRGGRFEETAL